MAEANVKDLQRQAGQPVKQAGGSTVQQFFEANKGAIEAVLPKHMTPDRLMKIAMQAIRTTPQLKECTTKSLFGAVIQCAEMGLEPNTVLGHAYLVPFKNRREGTTDVQVIIGYKGLVDLARRSGQITSIQAHAVREGDYFDYAYGLNERLEHVPAGDDSTITHFYAYAKFTDGGHAFEVLPRSKVDEIMRGTQSGGRYGPWKDHYEEMGRKTAIRRLSKFLPLSVELATAAAMDGQAEAGADQNLDSVLDGDYTVAQPAAEDAPGEAGGGEVPTEEEPETPLAEAGGGGEAPAPANGDEVTLEWVTGALRTARDEDALAEALDMGRDLTASQFEEAKAVYQERLAEIRGEEPPAQEEAEGQKAIQPFMDPDKAVGNDAITCLVCGKSFKTLTRHIQQHDMSPEDYRAAFGLSQDYPMRAPGLDQARQQEGSEGGSGLGERLAQARQQQKEQEGSGEAANDSTQGQPEQGGFPELE